MIQCFRGIGKSWITGGYASWYLKRHYSCQEVNFDINVMLLSAAAERAVGQASFIRQIINTWDFLRELRTRDGQRDSVLAFDVGTAGVMQQTSVFAAGITGQITGKRANLIIADDVEIPSNALTQLKRDRLDAQVRELDAIIRPEHEGGGEIKYLGTPQIEDSLYARLGRRGVVEMDGLKPVPFSIIDIRPRGFYENSNAKNP